MLSPFVLVNKTDLTIVARRISRLAEKEEKIEYLNYL